MATKADVIVERNADWRYWDPVMQTWNYMVKGSVPTSHDDIFVTGTDQNGNEVTIYFKTDREGSWLGGTHG